MRFTIMCADNPVIEVDMDMGLYRILNHTLMPWGLKGRIRNYTSNNQTHIRIVDRNNENAVISWLAGRVLSLDRKNAKWLYNLLEFDQVQTDYEKAKVALTCHSVSVLDNYWTRFPEESITWTKINIRTNHLNDIIAQVALHGKALTLSGEICTPEFTTNGVYAKAWRRCNDGLWLYKAGDKDSTEARIEVMCSNILDKMNVTHCHYELRTDEDLTVSACPIMTSDKLSIVDAMTIYSCCNRHNINFDKLVYSLDAESMYKMTIVDYLISNRDRHTQNWGFYFNPNTTQLLGCHPLFDHNNAFDKDCMYNRDYKYPVTGKSVRDSAKYAMSKVNFYFTQPITRSDFITERQYKEFMWRAEDLYVQTHSTTFNSGRNTNTRMC